MLNTKSGIGEHRSALSNIKPKHPPASIAIFSRKSLYLIILSVCVLPYTTAWAAGANTAVAAVAPTAPASVNPSKTQKRKGADCSFQYNDVMNDLAIAGVTTQGIALSATIASETAVAASLYGAAVAAATQVGFANPSMAVPFTAAGLAKTAKVVSYVTQAAGLASSIAATVYSIDASLLPSCDTKFMGTVKVEAGGSNITGNSIYNDNLGVVRDLSVGGFVSANQINAAQGISAMGGAITIGDPNGTTYSSGITIGGGAISGAGTSGAQATTGHVDAIAIGNGANATTATSTALGASADASSINSTSIGATSIASGENATAIGQNSKAVSIDSTAIGVGAVAIGENSVALGKGSASVRDNTVSVGNKVNGINRKITNVAAGVEGNDVVNVTQFLAGLDALDRKLTKRINQTGALTAAMSQIQLPRGAYSGLGVGLGTQGGRSAIALGFVATVSPNLLVKLTAGNSGTTTNAAAGITLGW